MRRIPWIAGVVVLCLLSVACQQAASLSAQDKAAIQKAHDEFARLITAEKADPAGLVKMFYADNARVLPPNMPALEGHDAIVKGFTAMGQGKTFTFGSLAITGGGDTAYVDGTYTGSWVMPGSPEPMTDKGKFLEVFQKQADGSWKATKDMWSSDAPPPGLILPTGAIARDAGPELKDLAWFAGKWTWEGEAKTASPFGPAGKSAMNMDCRWFAGGQHLFCSVDGTTPAGPYRDLMIMTYDADTKALRGFDADNTGMASPFALAFRKGVWTMEYDLKAGGKPVKLRATMFDVTAAGCSFKQEMAMGGGAFTLVFEGKARKIPG